MLSDMALFGSRSTWRENSLRSRNHPRTRRNPFSSLRNIIYVLFCSSSFFRFFFLAALSAAITIFIHDLLKKIGESHVVWWAHLPVARRVAKGYLGSTEGMRRARWWIPEAKWRRGGVSASSGEKPEKRPAGKGD